MVQQVGFTQNTGSLPRAWTELDLTSKEHLLFHRNFSKFLTLTLQAICNPSALHVGGVCELADCPSWPTTDQHFGNQQQGIATTASDPQWAPADAHTSDGAPNHSCLRNRQIGDSLLQRTEKVCCGSVDVS